MKLCKSDSTLGHVTMHWELGLQAFAQPILKPTSAKRSAMRRSRQVVPKSVETSKIRMDAGSSRSFAQTRFYLHSFEAQANSATTASLSTPQTYIDRGQGPKHFSCLGLLNELIPKVTGYTMYSLIRPAPNRPTAYLYIDPVGVVLIMSLRETSADTLGFLVDHDVQVPSQVR